MPRIILIAALAITSPAIAIADPSTIRMALPEPLVAPAGTSSEYLAAARQAVQSHHAGLAMQALEMAQTRLLDRSTEIFRTHDADPSPVVAQIDQARQALAAGDLLASLRAIDAAERGSTP